MRGLSDEVALRTDLLYIPVAASLRCASITDVRGPSHAVA